MPQHGRVLWRNLAKHSICTVFWPIIGPKSYVVVTVAEAALPEGLLFEMPVNRFIGEARHMTATNIAPFPGGVRFSVHWDALVQAGQFPYLHIWTDITVFDPTDPSAWIVSDRSSVDFRGARPDWRPQG